MSVQTETIEFINHITGSAGGWPTLSNAAIIGGMDYIIESGSNETKFVEYNTNTGIVGSAAMQTGSYFDVMADYAVSQSYDKCYVYGMSGKKQNPTYVQQGLISSSFARHNIPVTFEYQMNTSHTYFSQRGLSQYSGSFHLFFETPWYSDDNLLEIVSGSFNKNTFRTILSNSPMSSSLIPLFNTSSYTPNNNFPDFVVKNPATDSGIQSNSVGFYTYNSTSASYQNAVDSGSLIEEFMIHSGSYRDGQEYLGVGKVDFMMTPEKNIVLAQRDAGKFIKLNPTDTDSWNYISQQGKTSASGSLIQMFDGTTKQVQDVEVGDVVTSYQPLGMPDESQNYLSYTTTDLSGSTTQGSIVVNVMKTMSYGHILINGSIKAPYNIQQLNDDVRYFVKQGDTWSWLEPNSIEVGDYFLDPSGNETEITSITDGSGDVTWYSLDVEDIDTYFQSNILVHNIPPKCFVAGTPITMGDGTTKAIEFIEVGDEIKNYDFEMKEIKVGKVLSIETPTHADIIEISFGDKKTKNTFDHPYWIVGKGWSSYKPQWTEKRYDIKSEQLEVGDKCLELNDGKLVEVVITDLQEDINPVQTYSLEVETHHNYFANDVLVHNKFCFMPDQVINMGEGNYKRIDEIELGESVLVFDEENDEFKEGKVNSIMKKLHDDCYEMHLESGQTLKPTGNHPFLIKGRGWSTIDGHKPNHAGGEGKVEVGDYVRDLDGWVMIDSIKKIDGEHITYNLLNQDYGTIVAHDIVSHNSRFCFKYDTMITLADGTYEQICRVRPNDMIKTYDVETGKLQDSKVIETVKILHDNIVTYTFDNDTKITATDDHPFYIVGDSYIDSDYRPLTIGDVVLDDELNKLKVVHIEVVNKEEITYNINSTDSGVNYFANKVLVSDESDT
tara:strand:+ start:91 stop:2769 length:2679 start_codon:yes stop_codon:yes gene_type:complete